MSGMTTAPGRIGALILATLFLALLLLLFAAIYFLAPNPFTALWAMGILALILALGAYFAQALSRDPSLQRSVGWGLGAMGFALLFGTIWAGPSDPLSTAWRVYLTLPVLLVLIATVALARWRMISVAHAEARVGRRSDWERESPKNAFDYPAAQSPGASPGNLPPAGKGP